MQRIKVPRSRREGRRIPIGSLCSLLHHNHESHALVVDVSTSGLRVQRPVGGPRTRTLQLEFELPSVDEIVWAKGVVCFDEIWRVAPCDHHALSGVLRTSGIRLVAAAERHKRLLRDFVIERARSVQRSMRLPGVSEPTRFAHTECDRLFDFP